MIKALMINSDGSNYVSSKQWDLKEIQEVVGGFIEAVSFGDNPYFAYINEEGKLIDLEENKIATEIWYDSGQRIILGDYLAGNVIFFGLSDLEGDNTEVPESLINKVQN